MRIIIALLLFAASAVGQTFSYSPTACSAGTVTYAGVSVTVVCGLTYSTSGNNSAYRTYDLYYLTSNTSTNNARKVAYIHGGPTTGGLTSTTTATAYNWWSTTANPDSWKKLVAMTGWNVYVVNYTLLTSTSTTQQPADRTDIDCFAKSVVHNSGTSNYPGGPQFSLMGSSWGGYLAAVVNMSGPFSAGNSVCEYTDSYAFDSVTLNSPLVDFVGAYNCGVMTNCSQLQGYIQLYIPCSTTPGCTGTTAQNLSPLNTITTGKARMLMMDGVNDTWLLPSAQAGAFYTVLINAGISASYFLQAGTGHLLDEQCNNLAGCIVDPAIVNFINNTSPVSSGGSTFRP